MKEEYDYEVEALRWMLHECYDDYLKVVYGFMKNFEDDEDFPEIDLKKVEKDIKFHKGRIRKVPELEKLVEEDEDKTEKLLYYLIYFSSIAYYNIGKDLALVVANFDTLKQQEDFGKKLRNLYSKIKSYTTEILNTFPNS